MRSRRSTAGGPISPVSGRSTSSPSMMDGAETALLELAFRPSASTRAIRHGLSEGTGATRPDDPTGMADRGSLVVAYLVLAATQSYTGRGGELGSRRTAAFARKRASGSANPRRPAWTMSRRVDPIPSDARIRMAKQACRALRLGLLQIVQLESLTRGHRRARFRCRGRRDVPVMRNCRLVRRRGEPARRGPSRRA
jgi:hypothetical protein